MELDLIIGLVGTAKFYMSIDGRIMIFNHYLHTVDDETFYMSVDLLKIYSAWP